MGMKKNLLEAKMKLFGDNQSSLAEVLDISIQTLNRKLNGTDGAQFNLTELRKITERYNLTPEGFYEIFLA